MVDWLDTFTRRPAPRPPLLCPLLFVSAVGLGAETVSVDLALGPPVGQTNRVTMTVDAGFDQDTDVSVLTGNTLVNLTADFDSCTHVADATGIEFTGGEVLYSDVSLQLVMVIIVPVGTVDIQTTGMGATNDTPIPPGPVSNGTFETVHHVTIIDRGIMDVTGTGLLADASGTNDFGANPLGGPGSSTGALAVVLQSVSGFVATYDTELSLPLDVVYADSNVTITLEGEMVATGSFQRVTSADVQISDIWHELDQDVALRFATDAALAYQVRWRPTLTTGEWQNAGAPLPGTGTNVVWQDDGSDTGSHPDAVPQRFYQVRRRLAP